MSRRTVRTMCPMNCLPTVCGMRVEIEDDRVVGVHGDPENPESRGFLCIRGRSTGDLVDNPRRLGHPSVRDRRQPDAWRQASWDESLDRIAGAIQASGPEKTAIWPGHGAFVNSLGVPLSWRFANMLGAQWWMPSIVCWGLGGFGVWLTGLPHVNTADDVADNSDLVLLWGANFASQPTTAPRIVAAHRRGARVLAIDVRRTEACDHADEYLLVRPGTDAALALGLMHVIIREGLHDEAFVAEHSVGFAELARHVEPWTPERAAAETGLEPEQVVWLAREYAASRRSVILLGGSSMNKTSNRWNASRAISCLPALTGNLGRPGAGMGPRHGAGTQTTALSAIVPPDTRSPEHVVPSEMSTILERIESGDVEVLVLPGTNMLSSFTGGDRLARALSRTRLVACVDLFMSDTAREFADVVLPGTAWLEETGLKLGPTHVHLMDRMLEARGEARPLWQIYKGLADRLGLTGYFPWQGAEDLVNALLDTDHTDHATVERLRREGPSTRTAAPSFAYESLEFPTPSGKVELFSQRAADMGLSPLPEYEAPESGTYPLQFVQGRTLTHFHSFYDHGQALPGLAKADPEPVLWLHPTDAEPRGVEDGTAVRLHNARGSMAARARVTDRVPPGVVWMRDGWLGINHLTGADRVLPEAAVRAFPAGGQATYDAQVEVVAAGS
jgi:anaerobic selenocysteine-containing dehydrogenase